MEASAPWIVLYVVTIGMAIFGLSALGNLAYKVLEKVVAFKLEIMEEEHRAKIRVLRGFDQ